MKKILITSALPYINNFPHMGHIVGCHLPADIFNRFNKSVGNDTVFIGGSDEHGTAALISAREFGMEPKTFVDKLSKVHKQIYDKLNISYDIYSGTSVDIHKEITYDFFDRLKNNGLIEEKISSMPFCEHDNIFLADRFLEGTCSVCGYDKAYGDQCDKCGTTYDSDSLINPHCKFCGKTPLNKETKHYYFKLDKVQEELDAWIEKNSKVWRPHVYAEAKRWIKEGLKPRCITRDVPWGIKIKVGDTDEKVFYVWFEAPIAYISFVKELLGEKGLEDFWLNKNAEIYHFIGKDNIPFHSVFFPAMLLGTKYYNLPTNVVGLNFMNFEGQKFSKSKGVGVFCNGLLDSDIDIDTLRAYLVTVLPENKDSDFKWEGFRDNTNSELVGKYGNFFNRTLNMIQKNFDGKLGYTLSGDLNEYDREMIDAIEIYPNKIKDLFAKTEFREAYKAIMAFAAVGNVYLEKSAPWTLIKNGDLESAKKVLYLCLCMAKSLAIVASPIIPVKAQEIYNQIGFSGDITDKGIWKLAGKIDIEENHCTLAPKPLFARIDDEKLEEFRSHFSKPLNLKDIFND